VTDEAPGAPKPPRQAADAEAPASDAPAASDAEAPGSDPPAPDPVDWNAPGWDAPGWDAPGWDAPIWSTPALDARVAKPPAAEARVPLYAPSIAPPTDAALEPPDAWDRAAAWAMQRGALPALALITLGMVLIYAGMFRGELAGDDLSFHMTESARIADCLRAGDFDFWNPMANGGFASAYYYQVVPQLASAIPAAVFGHHLFFFELSVFLPLVLAPAAAYRGMRLMGASPWQAALGALAIGFMNGESRWGTGNAGTFNVGLYTQTWALAAFPMALGHAVRWGTYGRGLAPAIAWGTFVTLCHPFAGVSLAVALVAGVLAQLVLRGLDAALSGIGPSLIDDPARGTFEALCNAIGQRWTHLPRRPWLGELRRLAILGGCLGIAWMPIWLPLLRDYEGFGGFPHRVSDEVGPGFSALLGWFARGEIFDFARPIVLTSALPVVLVVARSRFLRWLWAPALIYALWLGLGPHLAKTDDDLIPAVRFLGAMQVVMGMAIGAGFLWICKQLWDAAEGSLVARAGRCLLVFNAASLVGILAYALVTAPADAWYLVLIRQASLDRLSIANARVLAIAGLGVAGIVGLAVLWTLLRSQYAMRTSVAAICAALGVLLVLPGARVLASRVHVLPDFEASHGDELHTITWLLRGQPPGRKQVGLGAENHWWNLLSYEYGRRPSLLMMGGGGLQASPNYDFLWTVKDFTKNAWVYDAPIVVFQKSNAEKSPKGPTILETKNFRAVRLPSPGLVSPVQITGTLPAGRKRAHAAAIAWFKTDEPTKDRVLVYPDPDADAGADAAGPGTAGPPPHGTVTRALQQDSPGTAPDIYAEVEVTEPTTFMARESWHPRWHAFVDGAPVPVRRVTPDFPAVDVPPGKHVLTFRFDRPWWMHAAWLAWPLLTLLAWRVTRRGRFAIRDDRG
jgi:hypothetical protein